MKRILITGANSYIGTSFENYLRQWPDKYQIDTVDMVDGTWRQKSFAGYNTIFHVAAIAHIRETRENAALYFNINHDLAVEAAKKAKAEGVNQFIFLSTMSVYGMTTGVITRDTALNPKTNYAKSKMLAEKSIVQLEDKDFTVAVLRPPMVYGKGCKGNYRTLQKWAKVLPFFPDIQNKRSMVEINTLCEYVKRLIDEVKGGLYFPQDSEYICTSQMVKKIAVENNHNLRLTKFFNPLLKILRCSIVEKVFGDLVYKGME